jgi:hypothetical protein
MNSDIYLNSGRSIFKGGELRSPRAAERSGSVSTEQAHKTPVKTKTYTIIVKDGALKIDQPPRKVPSK